MPKTTTFAVGMTCEGAFGREGPRSVDPPVGLEPHTAVCGGGVGVGLHPMRCMEVHCGVRVETPRCGWFGLVGWIGAHSGGALGPPSDPRCRRRTPARQPASLDRSEIRAMT